MKSKPLTDADLKKLFKSFNEKYFDNQVPEPQSIRFADMTSDEVGADGSSTIYSSRVGGEIKVNKAFARHHNSALLTLLHEMVHHKLGAEYVNGHGYRFGAEITRLWNVGAYEGLL